MNDSAVAAIKYALEKCDDDSDSMMFLRYWNEGEFDVLRRNWENIPDEVFTDADPLFKSPAHIEDGVVTIACPVCEGHRVIYDSYAGDDYRCEHCDGSGSVEFLTPPASEQQQTVQQPHTVEFVGKTCQRVLMAEGKPYPRTCAVCGLSGPCKSFPRENDR